MAALSSNGTAILIRRDRYDRITDATSLGNRARATVLHEFAHAVVHVPIIRRYRGYPFADLLLRRVRRDSIKPYNDPEWQAWALAGCIIAPRDLLLGAARLGFETSAIASMLGISPAFLAAHTKRLKVVL